MFYKKGCNIGPRTNLTPINIWDEKAIIILPIIIIKGPSTPSVSGEGFKTNKLW
jgi:hypothetical protein